MKCIYKTSSREASSSPARSGDLPAGHRVVHLGTVTSTNAVGLERVSQGEPGGLWVVADRQEGGRGRGGRAWSSPPGNLYASHLLRPACALGIAQQLTLVAPVALADAVGRLLGRNVADATRSPAPRADIPVRLKWP